MTPRDSAIAGLLSAVAAAADMMPDRQAAGGIIAPERRWVVMGRRGQDLLAAVESGSVRGNTLWAVFVRPQAASWAHVTICETAGDARSAATGGLLRLLGVALSSPLHDLEQSVLAAFRGEFARRRGTDMRRDYVGRRQTINECVMLWRHGYSIGGIILELRLCRHPASQVLAWITRRRRSDPTIPPPLHPRRCPAIDQRAAVPSALGAVHGVGAP